MESNCLLSFEDFLSDEGENIDSKKGEKVVNILAAISKFGPKEEITEWINKQPLNSPIFKCERSFLEKAIYAFKSDTRIIHISSFLPFTDNIDYQHIFSGKFGVKVFKKFNKTIDQIQNYKIISNRYVYPEDIEKDLSLNERIIDLSVNHYSVFEFVPLLEKCLIALPFYHFVSFIFHPNCDGDTIVCAIRELLSFCRQFCQDELSNQAENFHQFAHTRPYIRLLIDMAKTALR